MRPEIRAGRKLTSHAHLLTSLTLSRVDVNSTVTKVLREDDRQWP